MRIEKWSNCARAQRITKAVKCDQICWTGGQKFLLAPLRAFSVQSKVERTSTYTDLRDRLYRATLLTDKPNLAPKPLPPMNRSPRGGQISSHDYKVVKSQGQFPVVKCGQMFPRNKNSTPRLCSESLEIF